MAHDINEFRATSLRGTYSASRRLLERNPTMQWTWRRRGPSQQCSRKCDSFRVNRFRGSSAFIGVEKSATGTWVYSDGSALNYTNWAPGQPANGDCAAIGPDTNKWHSVACETALPYFCGLDGDARQCPSGWVYLPETDHCYFLQNFTTPDSVHWQLYNWTTAEMDCQNMGAHLASIHSKFENEFIYKWIYYDGPTVNGPVPNTCDYSVVWIGLTGTLGSDSKWSDGTFYDFRDPNAKPTALKSAKWAVNAK
ncbi:unnamed protein product, partial [Mesorhabditis spiculigera]